MRKLKLFLSLLMVMLLSVGNVWATFSKATSIAAGDVVAFVCEGTTMDLTSISSTSTKYGIGTAYTGSPACTWTFTVETGSAEGSFAFKSGNDYLSWSSGNSLQTSTTKNANSSWTVVIEDGHATITNVNTTNRVIWWNVSSPRFACYTSKTDGNSYKYVQIYKQDGSTQAKTLSSVAVSGAPTKTSYYAGQDFDPTGLTVKGTYDDSSVEDITSGITWTYNPSQTLVKDQTSIGVIATVSEIASAEFNVTGLTVTEASPKITITQNEVADFAASYAEYTWTAGGVSGKMYAYKNAGMQFNSSKTGYYVYNTDPIPGRITKITMTKASGTDRSWTPYVSTTAMTSASGTALDAQTVTTSGASWDVTGSNSYFYLTVSGGATVIGSIVIEYTEEAGPAVDAPSISGDVNFVGSTTVTISHDDADHIYYTTNGVDPTTSSTEYTAPFVVNADGTTTVKAIAVKGSDVSEVASKGFTKVTALESLAALLEATTSSETAFNVVIDNWVVTGVQGTRAWIADAANEKGILLYKSGHGFTAGKKLNGVVLGTKTKLYQGYPEMTTLVSTDVTVTDAEAVTPRTTTIAALTSGYNAEQGTVVKLEDVTYSSSVLTDGVNSIAADNKLFSSLALVDGTTYDIIGVVEYLDGSVVKIMPRSADDVVAKSAVSIPTAANLAALKAAERGTYILTLTNAVVTYVNGKNVFVEEGSTGVLIRLDSHSFEAGNCLNGDYQVNTEDYQGKFEITAIEPQAGAATTTAEIPLTTVSIATLNANFGSYESRRVKIVGANVTDAISGDDRNGVINDGAALAVYAAAGKNVITLTANDNVDIIGYPGYYNTDEQLNVWAQADITINVKEDPELAYNPAVVNVLLSDLNSFTPADLEHATGFDGVAAITYESSDPSIATVETDGTVTLVATAEGSTTITATFSGNATYKADNASYTINVSAAPIAPVYTMSFDLTRASYDDAADAQVVWNSNVVTMTADKNDGTKVTNYLAGNYTGTTLIAETRFYAKNSISFVPQEGVSITKIEWMSTAKGYATNLAAETFVNATAAVDGTDDKLVIITPSAAGEISVTLTDPARATAVTVYYEAESEKAKLVASISIDNINTAVGEDDILLSDIAATSNPNKKAISYAITSGTAVSIVGEGKDAAFHAVEEGTATITATIPNDLGNYTGATETFDIIVSAGPATLESIAISGTASVLEYTEGQDFNPAGLVVTGHYSDNTDAEISEGITWAFDPSPLTVGTTSVSVTATVSEISSSAFEVNGLTVSAAAAPTTDNVVILAVYDEKYYAMSTNNNASNAFTAIAVEYDGTKVTVKSDAEKTAIQWTRTTNGDNTTFQTKGETPMYMKGTSNGAAMSLNADVCNWSWDGTNGYYYIGGRSFFYQNAGGVFKNYSISTNMGQSGYSDKAQVIVIDPENIVITAKVSAELAYDPAEVELTVGDDFTPAALTYAEGFDGLAAVTYESSNTDLATVEGGFVSLVADATGTATITATFAGNNNYLAGSASYTITVNAPAPVPTTTTYRKVTATAEITDGEYLIVYETTSVAFNGALETLDAEGNSVAVVINEGVIAGTTAIDAAVFTIDVTAGTLKSASGKYIGVSGNSNGLKQTEDASTYTHTFSIDGDGNAVIFANFESSTMKLRYNPSTNAGNLRFRYYKNDGQQAIQLYKKETVTPEPPVVDYTEVRDGLTAGWYYTMCLDKAVTAVQGGTIWKVVSKAANGNDVILEEVTGTLAAGRPYIFRAAASTLEVAYTGDAVGAPVNDEDNNGLVGSFTEEPLAQNSNHYIIYKNALYYVNSDNVYVGAHRAYLDMTGVPAYSNEPQQGNAPRRRVTMTVYNEQTTTGIDELNASEAPVKMIIDGQLFIIRGEKMFNANGQLVK